MYKTYTAPSPPRIIQVVSVVDERKRVGVEKRGRKEGGRKTETRAESPLAGVQVMQEAPGMQLS